MGEHWGAALKETTVKCPVHGEISAYSALIVNTSAKLGEVSFCLICLVEKLRKLGVSEIERG